jgi:hypothetical protein
MCLFPSIERFYRAGPQSSIVRLHECKSSENNDETKARLICGVEKKDRYN